MNATLHYIYDPLCGWCYGAAPLVAAARTVLPVAAHAGGMMAGSSSQPVTPALRNYVMPHDQRIAGMTGQSFGENYFNGLLQDSGAVFDSGPPIAAILAMQALDGRGLDMLSAIQLAHYRDGKRIADVAVLRALAQDLNVNPEEFDRAYRHAENEELDQHIADSRAFLNEVGGRGFPTFVLQRGDELSVLDAGRWLGRPDHWLEFLQMTIAADRSAESSAQNDDAAQCGIDDKNCG
ncbi:DsbA family protein [Herbaspirillum lusitanum]|uniref:DsbA family protein n=1 Tax=Herbaspirillum lusitanum TaxID=213312 RepID=A0ABW9A7F2_9BURK